ncbi:MAG: glycosyltransferase family 2 protein [Thermodesulfovibrionales bacterium]|jgi:abequosyltransferase
MHECQKKPFLSILITTYNRSFFLRQCLSSIYESFREFFDKEQGIEIIVLNNGSNDETHEVLQQYENTMPLKILYEKDNISFIPGILKCISKATGKYCWFLGDDDFLINGMDDLLLFLEQETPDILLLNHYFYMYKNNEIKYIMKNKQGFLFKKPKGCYSSYTDYILNVRHNNAFFTHIAPVIFKKDQWDSNFSPESAERHFQSYSAHIYFFLSILKNSKIICFFRKPKVVLRVGAPIEALLTEEYRYYRFVMDVQYFTDMFMEVFSEERLIRHFKEVMLKKSVLILLLGTKLHCSFPFSFYLKLIKLLYSNYKTHPFFWYGITPVLLTPRIVFSLANRLYFGKSSAKKERQNPS